MERVDPDEHRKRMLQHAKGKTKGKRQIVLQLTESQIDLLLESLEFMLGTNTLISSDYVSVVQMTNSIKIQTNRK
jgi:hypothetical protein